MSSTDSTMSSSLDEYKNKLSTLMNDNPNVAKFIKLIALVFIVLIIVSVVKWGIAKYKNYKKSKVWILKGTKSAKRGKIIFQNPAREDAITLGRSDNETAGLEFTYGFWMYVDDWAYKYGQWKHVMHKGNSTSWPNRAPGIWLHPKENIMRVYMNTFKNIGEFSDIENIPLNKWFHVVVAVRQQNLDVYINGNLVKRKVLEGLPKQNAGDLYLNSFRGFSGFLSQVRYFDYYVNFSEIDNMLQDGPSSMPCVDSNEMPPYFSSNWWANSK